MTETKDVLLLLPKHWQRVLYKELEFLDKDRSAERDLISQQVDVERRYANDLDAQSPPLDDKEYSKNEKLMAKSWFDEEKSKLDKDRQTLQTKLTEVQGKIETQRNMIKSWEKDIQDLLGRSRALPTETENAAQYVEKLSTQLVEAEDRRFPAGIEIRKRDLEAAEAILVQLSSDRTRLLVAIDEGLDRWQEAMDKLRMLVVGKDSNAESQEYLEIQIKQIDKKLDYLQQQETTIILNYLEPPAE